MPGPGRARSHRRRFGTDEGRSHQRRQEPHHRKGYRADHRTAGRGRPAVRDDGYGRRRPADRSASDMRGNAQPQQRRHRAEVRAPRVRADRHGPARPSRRAGRGDTQHHAARNHARRGDPDARGVLGPARRCRVRRLHQSGIPARGDRSSRLLQPAQDGHRRAQPRQRRSACKSLRAHRGAAYPDRNRDRRDGQVRGQRLARSQGRFRQRDRQRLQRHRGGQPPRDGYFLPGHSARTPSSISRRIT